MDIKNEVYIAHQHALMGSNEIAALTGKAKSDVHVDIWNMVKQLHGIDKDDGKFHHYKNHEITLIVGVNACFDNRGYVSEFLLDRRHTEILITGYDVVRRAAIIDRWHALESGKAQPRIAAQPAAKESAMNNDLLSLARVVAEATASATLKAVIEVAGFQKLQPSVVAQPAAITSQRSATQGETDITQAEFVPVSDLAWACGLSDATCRRLATFAKLETCLSGGDRGHLLIHREKFMAAAQALLSGSTPPAGKRKRWQHPEFGGFILRLTASSVRGN